MAAADAQRDSRGQTWEAPVPIDASPVRPSFPTDCLPSILAIYTREVAQFLQVPVDIVVLSELAVLGTILQKRVDLDVGKGAVFPLNIWTLSVYPSGGGKSRALTEVRFPLDEREQTLQEKAVRLNEAAEADRQDIEPRVAELLRNKARSEEEEAELRQLRGRLRDLEERPVPSLHSSDLTMEALEMAMSANDGCHAVLNAEASDFFQIMAGRYAKEGQSSFGHFVSAYSQEDIKTKRALRGTTHIYKPTLTMGLSVQPSVFEKIASNREFVTRGLPARFLFAYPKDMRGSRDVDPPAITQSSRNGYNNVVRALTRIEPSRDARGRLEPYRVNLKMDARRAVIEFRQWAEDSMGPGGVFSEVGKEFAARMGEHLAKVTGILHCVVHPEQPWDICVERITVENAAAIVRWSAEHVLTTLGMGSGSEQHIRAAYLYSRIADQRKWIDDGHFTVRSLQQLVKRKDRYKTGGSRALEQDLGFLEELGYLQRCEMPKQGSKSTIFKISPFFLKSGPQCPQPNAMPHGTKICGVDEHRPSLTPLSPALGWAAPSIGDLGAVVDSVLPRTEPLPGNGLDASGDIGDQSPRSRERDAADVSTALGDW